MNAIKYAAFGLGALFLFACSFILFTVLSGTPMHEVAVIGSLFEAPETDPELVDGELDVIEELEQDRRPSVEVFEAASSPLSAFALASPFSAEELHGLQEELKAQIRTNETRRMDLDERDRDLRLREQHLEERAREFEQLRTALLETELELDQRSDELDRDARTQKELEAASWSSMAKIFTEGKPKDQVQKLILFGPEEAAKILRALPESRAAELIPEIPRELYREYADAYRRAESGQ